MKYRLWKLKIWLCHALNFLLQCPVSALFQDTVVKILSNWPTTLRCIWPLFVLTETCLKMSRFFRDSDTIATGGRGDHEVFIYKATKVGKLSRQHCLKGHSGWIIQIVFDTQNHILTASEDTTIRYGQSFSALRKFACARAQRSGG